MTNIYFVLMKFVFPFCFLFFLFDIPTVAQEGISSAEFYEMINSIDSVVVFDVRIYEKYVRDRIPGAIYAGEKAVLIEETKSLGKGQKILVYCDYGKRSGAVVEILEAKGFKNINHLRNGYSEWKREGFPVDNTRPAISYNRKSKDNKTKF